MNNIDEINAIANEIANNKQKPTVALVKAKLSTNVPLPKIIATLKSWQHQPEFTRKSLMTKDLEVTTSIETTIDDSIKAEIENAIAPLIVEINNLKKEIALLKGKQNRY